MADSEDEIDVEDISDAEHLSDLRISSECDPKDSWCYKHTGNHGILGPSTNSFSSEYCDPNSWLLDSNSVWSLDPCTDDRSKAAIEKMILEEQMYIYKSIAQKAEKSPAGEKRKQTPSKRAMSPKVKKQLTKPVKEISLTHRKPWTLEEQDQFELGLSIYGRSWTKIATMISTRTSLQVKNYANQYFKHRSKQQARLENSAEKSVFSVSSESSYSPSAEGVCSEENASRGDWEEDSHCARVVESTAGDDTVNNETDEDLEVDVDGSDDDDSESQLMPGQTTSCPDTVYSSLIRAAAEENSKDFVGQETISPIQVDVSENGTANQVGSFVLQDFTVISIDKLGIEPPIALREVEISSTPFISRQTEQNTDNVGDVSKENHLVHNREREVSPEQELENAAVDLKGNMTNITYEGDQTCDANSKKSYALLQHEHVEGIECTGHNGLNLQMSTSWDGFAERDWAPMSRGEVTSCESIPSSDHVQPGSSSPVSDANSPVERIVVDQDCVQELEKTRNSEFFMGRALKTPERYMKIRNYILDMWEKNKPNYLFKTAVRAGLRNCGDVNSIGRVHSFLEDIGAINVGCFDRPVPRVRQQGEAPKDDKEDVRMESWVNSLRPRKKRQQMKAGDWVDNSGSHGMTIEHLSSDFAAGQTKATNDKALSPPPRKRSSRSKHSYDPFLLVPCRKFPSCSAVPFDVSIQSEALVVMDAHAHFSTTEVIGLLGGRYFHESRTLKVSKAMPCRSLSTGVQCEMDPVSQTQASEELAGRGLSVVGWYHSHPTFAPIPSVRDIETQAKFQEWFGKGGAPFIGIIVSPYNYSNPTNQSQIRCLTVSEEWDTAGQYRLPYQFDYVVVSDVADEDDTEEQVRSIADDYTSYPLRVQLNRRYGSSAGFTMLDKLAESLRSHLATSTGEGEAFVDRLIRVIVVNLKLQASFPDVCHEGTSCHVHEKQVAPADNEETEQELGPNEVIA